MAPYAAVVDSVQSDAALSFDRIHDEYRPRILRYLTGLVGPADADDVAQLVFLKVSAALPAFRGDGSLATWMYRIARNTAVDWRRSASRAAEVTGHVPADSGGTVADEDRAMLGADETLMQRDMQQCLGRVVQQLPEAYREVLTLRDVDGLSTADVADALGLSVANVKVRLHRARGHLRRTIVDRCQISREGRRGLTCERKSRM